MRFTSDNYPKQLQITLEYTFQYHSSLDTPQYENEWLTIGPYRQKYVCKVTMANISSGLAYRKIIVEHSVVTYIYTNIKPMYIIKATFLESIKNNKVFF